MLVAVESGNAKDLAELMRQDPGFNVNMAVDGNGWTLLHHACAYSYRSAVIPLLLAHPAIDVNVKDTIGQTPFYLACRSGRPSCVREMLKDSRVKVNEPDDDGYTPPWIAAHYGHLDVIKWWIVSGREMDLGKPGDDKTDAIGVAKKNDAWSEAAEEEKVPPARAFRALILPPPLCMVRCSPEETQGRSRDPAEEIQGEPGGNQACNESENWSA